MYRILAHRKKVRKNCSAVYANNDLGERDVAEEEPRGLGGLRLLLPQSAGQVVIAAGLGTLPYALRTCDEVRPGS